MDTAENVGDIEFITQYRRDMSIIDGIDDRIHPQSGVYGGHNDGLGEGPEGGDQPLGTGVLKDGEAAGSGPLFERGRGGSRQQAPRS
mmetsp:Transcript_28137/g.39786  ORF Transcript_28137/g.39786 Transcript_28137/m.39786 type:complete len:87 (+) Transcript_28137:1794-2054(+)